MDVYYWVVVFVIVATFVGVPCLIMLCTWAYLTKIDMNSRSGSDDDLPMCVPCQQLQLSADLDFGHRDSFGFDSIGGGGPISSITPNVSSLSSMSGRDPNVDQLNSILVSLGVELGQGGNSLGDSDVNVTCDDGGGGVGGGANVCSDQGGNCDDGVAGSDCGGKGDCDN